LFKDCNNIVSVGTFQTSSLHSWEKGNGYGARLPMLLLSPYVKVNYVDHSVVETKLPYYVL